MNKKEFENIKINAYGLEDNAEYKEIGTGSIKELFLNTTKLKDMGLFFFDRFNYSTAAEEIEFLKETYELEDEGELNTDLYIKALKANKNIEIKNINDILFMGVNSSGDSFCMNLSSCNDRDDIVSSLNELIKDVYGQQPTKYGIRNKIMVK